MHCKYYCLLFFTCEICCSLCPSSADSVRFHRQLAFKVVAIFRRMSNIYVVPYPALLGMEFVRTQELDEEISYLLTLPAAGNPSKLSLQISIFLHSAGVSKNFKNMIITNTMYQKTKYYRQIWISGLFSSAQSRSAQGHLFPALCKFHWLGFHWRNFYLMDA